MSQNGEKKKRKKSASVEKSVPDFNDIQNDILDAYALISVGTKMVIEGDDGMTLDIKDDEKEDEHGHATVVLYHGVQYSRRSRES